MAHGVNAIADITELRSDCDAVLFPGGAGWKNLEVDTVAAGVLKDYRAQDKLIAAICAAPAKFLGPNGALEGKKYTCYPGLQALPGYDEKRVIADGKLVTGAGPGSSLEFGLEIVR